MKISLNWIFDHIQGKLSDINISQLVDIFIKTTAEIESWKEVILNVNVLTLARVVSATENAIIVRSIEHNREYSMSLRDDIVINSWYMIFDDGGMPKWATSVIFGGIKEMLLPAFDITESLCSGGWKSTIELHDYIIEIDNKSINNRPDLWGHRGLAREIAAMLNLPLKPIEEFIVQKDIMTYPSVAPSSINNRFSFEIKSTETCERFAALHISSISSPSSQLNIVARLSRIDSRAINFLVDATNYVMLDLGQPMHAFDADKLPSKKIIITHANASEKLSLLDGDNIELTSHDIIIADGDMPISLAGVMGGSTTSITAQTKSVLIESAHFDPTIIRRTSARHKKRTEASIRFEKSLDPYQNIDALMRFLFLMNAAGVTYQLDEHIISLGKSIQSSVITIKHTFIEQYLGILIQPERIVRILEKISFGIEQSVEDSKIIYIITVPSFRATKDIKIPEDIVEEVGRFIGYDTLPRVMPSLQLHSSDLHTTKITRTIKHSLSYGLMMHELYGYSFFDESVLRKCAWQPSNYIPIKNPISENYTRLVTTLQPHLIAAVGENSIHHTALRFYEWGRVWYMKDDNIVEQKSVSGIFFNQNLTAGSKEQDIDFYAGKSLLMRMFDELHMDIMWKQHNEIGYPWYSSHQMSMLMHNEISIGIAGMIDESALHRFSSTGGSAFIFEINADYLLAYKRPIVRFEPLSKYPSVRRDVSMLIPLHMTTDRVIDIIKSIDNRIATVTLIDFFTKNEWKQEKAMTFHVEMCDKNKTLISHEVDELWNGIIDQLQQHGAIIR
ncbi:MAG TPA: phenylalanine--tRNA ligase subunit beta [Candidatus Babeliales bacterium]|nr:phenylalanine--tRNA ligase subunit beta [Candidatus Babeliales bacterium]